MAGDGAWGMGHGERRLRPLDPCVGRGVLGPPLERPAPAPACVVLPLSRLKPRRLRFPGRGGRGVRRRQPSVVCRIR